MVTVANSPAAWDARAAIENPWEAALWSKQGQGARLEAVVRHLGLQPGDSILDFGSGPGQLAEFLLPHEGYYRYYAHDWSTQMLVRVERDHPNAIPLEEIPDRLFDNVVACGPFNLADNWWKQRTWDTLAELWANNTSRTLAVSVYRGDDPSCLRYTTFDLAVFAEQMGCNRFLIDGSYLDNDLLLVMSR